MTPQALEHLSQTDRVMRGLIRRIGPCTLTPQRRRSPYEALVRAVAHQQLNGRAAESILARFIALFAGKRFPDPDDVLSARGRALRKAGFSRAKVRAIKHIAQKAAAGLVPTRRAAARMSDEEIIARLTEIRGVGRWTVEMLLIFTLGRPDVLPADDFGVREGYRVAYGRRQGPTAKDLLVYGERWRPHRTTAAWYLWRAADQASAKRAKRKSD